MSARFRNLRERFPMVALGIEVRDVVGSEETLLALYDRFQSEVPSREPRPALVAMTPRPSDLSSRSFVSSPAAQPRNRTSTDVH